MPTSRWRVCRVKVAMGGYGAILKKHGLTKTAAKVESGGVASTETTTRAAAATANGVSGALQNLTIDGGGSKVTTYAGELNELTPAALVRDEGPPATQTKYRGYNTDTNAMKERMLKRHAARGGADGT